MAVARLDVLQAVVLVRRRAQRLGQHRRSPRRAATARRAGSGTRCRRRRSGRRGRGRAAAPCAPRRARRRVACSWIRPERSTRSRNAILPWPRRAAAARRRGSAPSVSSPAGRSACAALHRRDRHDAGDRRAGTGRRPSARSRSSLRPPRRRAARSPRRPWRPSRALQPDVDLGDLELALLAVRQRDGRRSSLRLCPISALPTGDSLESLRLGAGSPRPSRRSCTSASCPSSRP